MYKYIIIRVSLMIVTTLIVIFLLYFASRSAMLSMYASRLPWTLRAQMALRETQSYMIGLITRFDWGISDFTRKPVWVLLEGKIWWSLRYNLVAFVFYFFGGVFMGSLAGYFKGTWLDRFVNGYVFISYTVPSFILVVILVLIFGYELEWLPPREPSVMMGWVEALKAYIIPVFVISTIPLAKITLLMRGETVEAFNEEHLLLVRVKGLTKRQAFIRHSLKRNLVVIMPELVPTFLFALGVSFFVEEVYNIQGLANLFFDSMVIPGEMFSQVRIDVPVVVAIGTIYFMVVAVFGLVADYLIVCMDPRIRLNGENV